MAPDARAADLQPTDPVLAYKQPITAALVNHRQYERGAALVIPKVHRETILDVSEAEIASMYRLARRLARAVEAAFGACAANVSRTMASRPASTYRICTCTLCHGIKAAIRRACFCNVNFRSS